MTWVFIFITWLEMAEPRTQELLKSDEAACRTMEKSIRKTYIEAQEDDPKFGFIVECKERE